MHQPLWLTCQMKVFRQVALSYLLALSACASATPDAEGPSPNQPPASTEPTPPKASPAPEDPAPPSHEPAAAPKAKVDPILEVGRLYTEQFYDGKHQELFLRFSEELRHTLTGSDLFERMHELEDDYGGESEILEETVVAEGSGHRYTRTIKLAELDTPLSLVWLIDEEDEIAGFFIVHGAADGQSDTE